MSERLLEEVKVQLKELFNMHNDDMIDKLLKLVKECLAHRNYMTVCNMIGSDSAKGIDLAILQALLKSEYIIYLFIFIDIIILIAICHLVFYTILSHPKS